MENKPSNRLVWRPKQKAQKELDKEEIKLNNSSIFCPFQEKRWIPKRKKYFFALNCPQIFFESLVGVSKHLDNQKYSDFKLLKNEILPVIKIDCFVFNPAIFLLNSLPNNMSN